MRPRESGDARFCNGCGAGLAAPVEARREERKIVTVLFADLVGFTSRAERLDPEDVRSLLAPYWQHLRDELERFGGTSARRGAGGIRGSPGCVQGLGAPIPWAFTAAGEPPEYRELLERNLDRPSTWLDAGFAVADGDFAAAADIYGAMGARTDEAEARVHAARVLLEHGDRAGSRAQLARAVGFYREVGASRLIRDAGALLPATA